MDDERCGEGEFTYNTGDVYRGKWVEDKQSKYCMVTMSTHMTYMYEFQ